MGLSLSKSDLLFFLSLIGSFPPPMSENHKNVHLSSARLITSFRTRSPSLSSFFFPLFFLQTNKKDGVLPLRRIVGRIGLFHLGDFPLLSPINRRKRRTSFFGIFPDLLSYFCSLRSGGRPQCFKPLYTFFFFLALWNLFSRLAIRDSFYFLLVFLLRCLNGPPAPHSDY